MEEAVAAWTASHPGAWLQALLLGVTPAIVEMRWPEASSLMGVDSSMAMARALWPEDVPQRRWAVCGDWLALPRRDSSCGLVIGDGSMNCVSYPDGFRALARAVCDVLNDDGIFVLRCYVQPAEQEHPEQVFADIFRTAIPSFHHFKFRLLMALQQSPRQGIAVSEVYRFWATRDVDKELLISRTGWERPAVETIELYRHKDTVHTFPTLTELRSLLLEFFDEISFSTQSGNLGERCPIVVLRPRRIVHGCRSARGSGQ